METPKFAAGETVHYNPDGSQDRDAAHGTYQVLRQMPLEASGHSYRIKHQADGHERIAREHQLEPWPSTAPA